MGGSNKINMNTINFDKQTLKLFKQKYNLAIKNNKKSFFFEGNEVLVSYAKYVIEYVEDKINGD